MGAEPICEGMMSRLARSWSFRGCVLLAALFTVGSAEAQAPPAERVPLLFDTDLGTDIGDAFALGLILGSHELDLRGVTTVSGKTDQRALMACRFLTMTGRRLKSGAPYINLTERANVVLADSGKEIFRTENYGQPAPK